MPKRKKKTAASVALTDNYVDVLGEITEILEQARRASARSVNAIMTTTYWEVGRRIVEFDPSGEKRAEYGTELLKRLSADLTQRFGRGFSRANLESMRRFYEAWPISQTVSGGSPSKAASGMTPQAPFPLPWSHYVRLLSVTLPDESLIAAELQQARWLIEEKSKKS